MSIFKTLLPHRGILEVHGPDRASFLQGLITNDISQVSPTRTLYAALLTPQGRFLHDFFISEDQDAYSLETEVVRLEALVQKLSFYKLRSRVTLVPRPEIPIYALWGEGSRGACGLPEERGITEGNIFVDPRLAALGLRGRGGPSFAGFPEASLEEYNQHRLHLGVPEAGEDLIPEKSIPLECGLDELQAINWDKGCYMGQELTSRTKYRGLVRKHLFPVKIEGSPPPFGASILKEGKVVGEMRTHAKGYGLALLRLEAFEEPGDFVWENTLLTPERPLWMKGPEE